MTHPGVTAAIQPPRYAKAVEVQPRTLEVFEGMGCCGADDPTELVTHLQATFA